MGNDSMSFHRKFTDLEDFPGSAKQNAFESLKWESIAAQQMSNIYKKDICLELRENESIMWARKRFKPEATQ
jgi:hypothetical protein